MSFVPGKHMMQDTYAAIWWSNTEKAGGKGDSENPEQSGRWCYAGNGVRHDLGDRPSEDRIFTGSCS